LQIYREELNDTMVTYARGCQSRDIRVARDECNEFSPESCSTEGGHKVNMEINQFE